MLVRNFLEPCIQVFLISVLASLNLSCALWKFNHCIIIRCHFLFVCLVVAHYSSPRERPHNKQKKGSKVRSLYQRLTISKECKHLLKLILSCLPHATCQNDRKDFWKFSKFWWYKDQSKICCPTLHIRRSMFVAQIFKFCLCWIIFIHFDKSFLLMNFFCEILIPGLKAPICTNSYNCNSSGISFWVNFKKRS